MRRLASTSAAIICLLLSAQAAPAKDSWTSVRSQNFFLIGNAGDKEIRRVATRLEQFRDVFTRLFPRARFTSPVPTTVVVFKSHSSYKPFKPVVDGKISEAVAGYFQSGEDVNYITLTTESGGQNPYETIYHEYVHLLVNNSFGKTAVPPWFNEGLAEYYSTFDIDDDRKVYLGKLIDNYLLLLRQQRHLPLKTLFEVDYHSLHRNGRDAKGLFYAQSWALIHYLILGNEGKRLPQVSQFLTLLAKKTPTEQAFREAFQTDIAQMEQELKTYVAGRSFRGQIATFERKIEFDSELHSAPLSDAAAEAYLGDLLLHTDRPDDAAKRLEQAVALDPALGAAHASLGMARLRQKRLDEAKTHLRRAVAADAGSYLANYYLAYALSREGMDESGAAKGYSPEAAAEMRAALRKALALKPDFPESYHLLAWVNLVTGEELREAAAMLRKALALSPGNEQYTFILAQVMLRQSDFGAARYAAGGLARNASDPQMRANAQSLLDAIKAMEEQEERYKAAAESAARPDEGDDDSDAPTDASGGTVGTGDAGGRPRLRKRGAAAGAAPPDGMTQEELQAASAAAVADALGAALRQPLEGETRERGVLTSIECAPKRLVFHVRVGERLLRLAADGFESLHMMAYTSDAGGQITCGARRPESHVVVTFRPLADARAKADGSLVAVEFVPADFRLKQ